MRKLLSLVFGDRLQVGKTGFELIANHAVHIKKYVHQLRHVGAVHGPGDAGEPTDACRALDTECVRFGRGIGPARR